MMPSSSLADGRSAEMLPPPSQPGLVRQYWHDPLLRFAFLLVSILITYQLAITLVHPSWIGPVTDWLRSVLAWPEFALIVFVSLWLTRARRPKSLSWWMLSIAAASYLIARNLWTVYDRFIYPNHVPFPIFPDIFFILQYPFFFLSLILLPGASPWGPRLKVILDCVLLMAAVGALSWYFVLAPVYMQSGESLAGKIVNLAYPMGDLAMLFGMIIALIYYRCQAPRAVIGILIVAFLCLIIADSLAAWLLTHPRHVYSTGNFPDVFWNAFYLLVPLAGLVQFRFSQRALAHPRELQDEAQAYHPPQGNFNPFRLDHQPPRQQHDPPRRDDVMEMFHILFPLIVALLTCVVISFRAIILPPIPGHPLIPSLIIFALLLLALMRQGITVLENARLQRQWIITRANEQAIREAASQMETFLGIASHELRTPLTSMSLYHQLAERRLRSLQGVLATQDIEAPKQLLQIGEQLVAAQVQVTRLNGLVNDLLEVTWMQKGALKLQFMPMDLGASVRGVVEAQRQLLPKRNIFLYLSTESAVPIVADMARIEQVITNYLTNALKYSPEDQPVEVGVQLDGQQALVWVRDHGLGLPTAEQERIWERFYRAPGIEIQSGSGIGLGLGLYICKMIIEQHQGRVGVQSLPGMGSTFWFTFPLAVPEKQHSPGLSGS